MKVMKKWIAACVVLTLAVGGKTALKADDLAIKDVMKRAHGGKPSLYAKVIGGNASDDEKQMLVDLYAALGKSKPPKGDQDEWKRRTDELVAAAKDVAAGNGDATTNLAKAANCAACHKAHKRS